MRRHKQSKVVPSSLEPTKNNTLLQMNSTFVDYVTSAERKEVKRNREAENSTNMQKDAVVCK